MIGDMLFKKSIKKTSRFKILAGFKDIYLFVLVCYDIDGHFNFITGFNSKKSWSFHPKV